MTEADILHQQVTRALHGARQFPVSGLTSIILPITETLHQLIDAVYDANSEHPHTGGEHALESIGGVLARLTQLESETGFEVPRVHGPLPVMVLQEEEVDADLAERLGFDPGTRDTAGEPVQHFHLSDGRVVTGYVSGHVPYLEEGQ